MGRIVFPLLIAALAAAAQTADKPKRKTVGVALAGGSALGLAHVGVLQWLEEHRIPVDYIAGTSMGGLVAGLWATGHDSAEMLDFVKNVNWAAALTSAPPYRDISFRRKEDQREIPTNLEMGYKKGLQLPGGLSAGHGVGLILSRFAAPYSKETSFDLLPTPLRCVATDLVTSKEVVFDRGPLFEAMRATMSLPALFAPVERGKQILVDGGLVNNLPVDIVKRMGADIVIAVALDKPPDAKAYKSLLGVAGRSISVMITDNERRNIGLADLVLMPDLQGFDAMAFQRYEDFRKVGYEAAARKEQMLKMLELSEGEYRAYQEARARKTRPEVTQPKFIEVEGDMAPRRKAALIASLKANKDGVVTEKDLESELTKITGMGRYDTAGYQFIEKNGEPGIKITAHEKSYGPPFLKLGLLLDGAPDSGLRFGVGARITFLDFGGPASEWRSDLSIGTINRLATEYYYRFQGGKWFIAPRGYWVSDLLPFYAGRAHVMDYRTNTGGGGADLGYAFGRFQEMRFGYDIGHISYTVSTGPLPGSVSGRTSGFRGKWSYDKQNNPVIPLAGLRSSVQANWMTDFPRMNKQFPAIEGEISYARRITTRYSYIVEGAGGTTSGDAALNLFYTTGGLYRLSALARGQLHGSRYYNGRVAILRSLSDQPIGLLGRTYFTVSYEVGTAWTRGNSANPFNDGVIGVASDTPLGLLFFGGSVGESGFRSVLFRLGRYF